MIYDLAILGGGPAGITAGIYSTRQGMSVVLITKSFGGQMTQKAVDIENYPGFKKISGFDLIAKFEDQLRDKKIEIKNEVVISLKKEDNFFKIKLESEILIESKAVIIAAGSEPKSLNVLGEKEFIGKGVSYCTTCDGPLFQKKDIAIIGGGNTAFEAALFMQTYASKIYILEFGEQVRADKENQDKVLEIEKIKIITGAQLKEIKGEKFVNEIVYLDRATNQEKHLEVQGVFAQIGYLPASELVEDLADLSERKEIIVNHKTMETKTPGLYASGDVTDGFVKQIVVAAADGAKAAISAYKYLQQ